MLWLFVDFEACSLTVKRSTHNGFYIGSTPVKPRSVNEL